MILDFPGSKQASPHAGTLFDSVWRTVGLVAPPGICLTFLVTIRDLSTDTLLEVLLGGVSFTKPAENNLKSTS